jgi:hypothetical protein
MDNVKTKKLTSLISKLTVAANKAVKKHEPNSNPRKQFSITGLSTAMGHHGGRHDFRSMSLLRG